MPCRIPRRLILWESRRGAESINEELKEVRDEVRRLNTKNKPHGVVKFAGLNLDSLLKASAWISSHVAIEDIGLVVDPPTVFKHIYANLSGGDFKYRRWHKVTPCQVLIKPSPRFYQKLGQSSSRMIHPT
jgi:hypothetical protein